MTPKKEGNKINPNWPGSMHVNLETYYSSFRRTEDLGEAILPSHDWKTLEQAECR